LPNTAAKIDTLVLGIGNLLLGDEGVGVHAIRALEGHPLPSNARLLDGGTGSFNLLDPMSEARRIILIDATLDGGAPGEIRRLTPRFATDYPKTLTAHDIGLKDLLDSFYLMNHRPEVVLYAITVTDVTRISDELSTPIEAILPELVQQVLAELSR